ncbi:MAG: cation diffusion facilitator family transporter [Alistipes sp.]
MATQHSHRHLPTDAVSLRRTSRALTIGIAINTVYALIEFGIGGWQGSMGLVADAGHNMSDVAGLALALLAMKLVERHADNRYTFGYKKASVLISLVNALILLFAVAGIIGESIHRLFAPDQIEGWSVAITAGVGVVVNFAAARLLDADKGRDLNIKGAYLHMMLDMAVSVGVVVSGIIISFTGWYVIDPIIGLIVAAAIIYSSWELFHSSLRLAIDGVPEGIDPDRIVEAMAQSEGVVNVHHVHIWALSTTETALTAHIVVNDITRSDAIRNAVKEKLKTLGICHSTIETESESCFCGQGDDSD